MPTVDDELERRFGAAGRGGEVGSSVSSAIEAKRRRRAIRQRVQAVALTVCVVAGTVGGFILLDRMFTGDGSRPLGTPTPNVTPDPTPSPTTEGRDIGLGTNLCQDQRLGGLDLVPGAPADVAWTGYLVRDDGTCPERNPDAQRWVVAIDVTGDGRADASSPIPLVNCPNVACEPLGATDLDADGDQELVVMALFSILDQGYFAVGATKDGEVTIDPILVAEPGHPAAGIDPGSALTTSAGGDAGYGAWIRCENYPAAPVLVFTYVSSVVESEKPAEWHEVKLQLQGDGRFHVIDATDLSLPPSDDPGLIRSEAPACGLDFNIWAPPNP